MKKTCNKLVAFIMIFFTIFSLLPVQVFATGSNNVTIYVKAYDENKNVIYDKSYNVADNSTFDATEDRNNVSALGYVVSGVYSEYTNGSFNNKLSNNQIAASNGLVIYIDAYKDDNDNADSENKAYNFNIIWDGTKSISSVGWRYYDLNVDIKAWEGMGYTFVAAYGDRNFTQKIEDYTEIDLLKYPDIYVKFKNIHYICVSSSGVNTYEYYTPYREFYTLADTEALIKNHFSNADKINVDNYMDAEHKNKITDISYFSNCEDDEIIVYSVAYFKNNGPVDEKLYSVKFDLNAPEGKTAKGPKEINAEYNKVVTLKDASCDGYKFEGWYDEEGKVSSSYKVTENVILTAKWSKLSEEDTKEDDKKDSESESTKPDNSEDVKTETSEDLKTEDSSEDVKTETSENIQTDDNSENQESTNDEEIKPLIPSWYVIRDLIGERYKKIMN